MTEITSPAEQIGELVRYMASQLVENENDLDVTVDDRGSSVHIMLRVPESEMGRVIGRQGRIAKAMRTVVMIAGSRQNLRVSLDIDG
ncbi:MAG: KH domain-containing protein [Thermomicrobiales bacterium]